MIYDIIIIGAGPAGLSAAIYAKRAGLNVLVLEGLFVGGQAALTYEIENYPGFEATNGPELMYKMESHARKFDADIKNEEVVRLDLVGELKLVKTSETEYQSRAVIICTGAKPRLLDIEGEKEFTGRGVSYCATCDGAFYKGKDVAVIGGGNTAVEDALFLSRTSSKVYLIHRRDKFRAEKRLTDKLASIENIELILNSTVEEILESSERLRLILKNKLTQEESNLEIDGIFVAIGIRPKNGLFKQEQSLELDEQGYIITDENMATSIEGVFAAGDIRKTPLRQIITSAADGAVAAFTASTKLF